MTTMAAPTKPNTPIAMWLLLAASGFAALLNIADQIQTAEWYSEVFTSYDYSDESKGKVVIYIVLALVSIALFVLAAVLVIARKFQLAPIFTIAGAVLSTFAEMAVWGEWELPGFYFVTNITEIDFSYDGTALFLLRQFLKLFFYALIAISIFALISHSSKSKPKQPDLWPASAGTSAAPVSTITPNVTASSAAAAPNTQRGNTNMSAQWEVMIPGASDPQVDTATLQVWAMAGRLKPNTLVKEISTGVTYTAAQIPGVFSEKQFVTALILSILLGPLGIDRFYTGHVGLGVGKLLTAGGCGIWAIVDIILFATRKVNDSEGRPLS